MIMPHSPASKAGEFAFKHKLDGTFLNHRLEADTQSGKVYLPAHTTWKDAWTGKPYEGGRWLDVPAPIETIPLFLKADSHLIEVFQHTNRGSTAILQDIG